MWCAMRALTNQRKDRFMAKADLSAARLRETLHYDPATGVFTWLIRPNRVDRSGQTAGWRGVKGYWHIRVDGVAYLAHRLAWLYVTGRWPVAQIDHIDGVRANNAIRNLRDVSASVNQQNRRKAQSNSQSGVFGALKGRKPGTWRSAIGGGSYATPEAAGAAYLHAKRLLHEGCTI